MPKDKAEEHYKEYLEVVKTRKEKQYEDLKQVYLHLSKERKVLDIYEVFKKSGLNENGEPMLAIAPANCKEISFEKMPNGSGTFTPYTRWQKAQKDDVHLPTNTFEGWKVEKRPTDWDPNREEIVRPRVQTNVPIVPAHLLPSGDLKNYFILFEAMNWEEKETVAMAGDPYLLKRININTFVVLAEWDVSPIELAVMRG